MAVERIHLVLDSRLMRAFRDMADRGHRSMSGQFAYLVDQEIERHQQTPPASEVSPTYRGGPVADPARANREKGSHFPSP